jgi:hypothetical protein
MCIAADGYHGRHISSCMDHARAGSRERRRRESTDYLVRLLSGDDQKLT